MLLKDRVLLWVDNSFLHYGIAKYLQEQNYDLFAIIDGNESINKFFQNQKLVQFNKVWYFYAHISKTTPNLDYLKKIEEKYKINMWSIICTDRLFYTKFNKYYQFGHDEILAIIEQECRFFEHLLNEIKPNYLLMNFVTQHYQYLIYKICATLGITVLTLEPLRFGDKCMIVDGTIYDLKDIENYGGTNSRVVRTIDEIRNFLKSNRPARFYLEEKSHTKYKVSKWEKFKAFLQFFFLPQAVTSTKQFRYYGRNRINALTKGTARIHLIKKKYREFFMNRNFIHKIDDKIPFVYFPLHYEPERVLFMGAPFYTDQLAVINNIAKSLPIGYKLYVKEHPVMETQGWRKKSFYKQIMELPNVKMIHPSITTEEIMKKCSLVITIRGTTSLEATFYGKPSVVFMADSGYATIPSIHILKNIDELPNVIRSSLEKKVDPSELNDYIDFIEKNSFEFPNERYSFEISNRFNYNVGYLKQVEIQVDKMESFLNEFSPIFQKVAEEYINKMNEYKEKNSINDISKLT